jgi:tetratricopeptide (TPR) repeat protein
MKTLVLALTLGCWTVLAAVSGVTRVHAQETKSQADNDVDAARSHFKTGVDYYRDGDLNAALIEFKRAYAAAPNYRLLYNLGQVSHERRDYAEAQGYFQRYLKEGAGEIDEARKEEVETALAKISARIAAVVLTSNVEGATFYVDDVPVGKSPQIEPVRVSAGTRRISATASGRPRITQVVEAAGGDTLVVKLEFPPPGAPIATLRPARTPAPEESSKPSPALWLGIGSGALGVGTGVMAYLSYADGANYRDALKRKTTAHELSSLHDRAVTKALVTDILLGATLVATAVTVVVALQGGREEERASASTEPRAELTIGAGSVGLTTRFQ